MQERSGNRRLGAGPLFPGFPLRKKNPAGPGCLGPHLMVNIVAHAPVTYVGGSFWEFPRVASHSPGDPVPALLPAGSATPLAPLPEADTPLCPFLPTGPCHTARGVLRICPELWDRGDVTNEGLRAQSRKRVNPINCS